MSTDLFQTIRKELGEAALKGSCLWNRGELHLTNIMEGLVLPNIGGQRLEIVEIGSRFGSSAAILARYGHVTTFDVRLLPEFDTVMEIGKRIANANGLSWRGVDRVIVSGASEVKQRLADMKFNLAHEDAAHKYDELKEYWPELSACGRVIFHDYDGSQPDVTRFIDERRADGGVMRAGVFAYWRGYPKVATRADTVEGEGGVLPEFLQKRMVLQ